MTTNYSTVQKLSLAGIVIGAVMCAVGAGAPYWLVFDPQGLGLLGSVASEIVDASTGLFMFCIEFSVLGYGQKGCQLLGFASIGAYQ